MKIEFPELSLILMVGISGSGKSTFCQQHFLDTEVLSSDYFRGRVSDDPNDQSVSKQAFEVLEFIARKRLELGKLTVIDATNVTAEARRNWLRLAREFHVMPVAIVLDAGVKLCGERNRQRTDRKFGQHVLRRQHANLKRSLRELKREGFRFVYPLKGPEETAAVTLQRNKMWSDRRDDRGPFDFIGDVHGCCDELEELLNKLGYQKDVVTKEPGWSNVIFRHPEGRKAVFVGDLTDRGPRSLDVLSVVRNMVTGGQAICVPGNHDDKLLRKLKGSKVNVAHGLAATLAELERVPENEQAAFNRSLVDFLGSLVSHYVLDSEKVVVAHAGLKEKLQGRASGKVRSFALYGETTGEKDELGFPVRLNWAADYRGDAMVVYGHTPVANAEWLNRTINIDTGCVFGGSLTALRYPELDLVSVPAAEVYCESKRQLAPGNGLGRSAQQLADDMLDAQDVIGKRVVSTRLRPNITIKEANTAAALEVISRFAVDPKWLIYLPPTMSPSETSPVEGYLEHPESAFAYFQNCQIDRVMCQEKHMGSRAVVVVCRDGDAARNRLGIKTGESGVIVTRTGRRFFSDRALEQTMIDRLIKVLTQRGFWETFDTNWACLDCELMPWSAKAKELIRNQYAAVAASANASLPKAIEQLELAGTRLHSLASEDAEGLDDVIRRFHVRQQNASRFRDAYRQYCWPATSIDDYRLAPFHLLATEGVVHVDKTHRWHMEQLASAIAGDDIFMATRAREVDLRSPDEIQQAIQWWLEMTEAGGEGMVIKPMDFVAYQTTGRRSELIQPAIKCRGKEYLRIIYGPDYDIPENLSRLRSRHLGRKRSLAIREWALGIESLERFVARQPLRRIHECVFGVLALESEPVDPRL